ncbi:vesicle transport protein SFT2C isoform X2 [Copidosoma floridanum]|uniref:vesicle transport protein SFT2C isoform X2 n=1 Tax=Copidosoma floridanum TaxID=29053 RepID=UPI0006C9906B|nr:vesicle transport protein SFT2C isoform X2 [Copidosoma floridanum]
MADLNKELNEYLLSSKNEKQYKLPSVSIPKPNIGKWLGRSTEEKQESGWLRETQRECCPTMTRLQRLSAFGLCFVMGIMCFCLSALYVPVLLLKARKFALLYSLGSLFFLMSFAFLWGPMNYMRSLFSKERRYFSLIYFSTLTGTLYFALHLQSTPLTVLCAILQLIAMLQFLISHIPGSTMGLMFFTRLFKSSVSSTLPV